MKKKISIIMPTHNEGENIGPLIKVVCGLLGRDTEIIVVDDLSTDGTREVVEELQKEFFHLKLIKREVMGLTSAIKRGISEAEGEIVGWMDCDFSHPPELLPEMVRMLSEGRNDCAVASRFLPESDDRTHKGSRFIFIHKIMSSWLNRLCETLLVSGFKDYTSGFIVVRKKLLNDVSFDGDYGEYFMELIFNASKKGYTIVELPFISEPRRSGTSKTAENLFELFLKGRKYIFKLVCIRCGL